jgi:hypothetical protein
VLITGIFGGNNYYMKSNYEGYLRFNDNIISRPYWTSENRSNEYPSVYFAGDGRYLRLQSRGFVRIENVSLSYNFRQTWIKKYRINNLKLFLSAKNLATITNWEGGDPEIGTTIVANTFPVSSTYSIGINVSF